MKVSNLFEYTDYRLFLNDRFKEEKETHPYFSYRYIGKKIGIDSGYLTKILQGALHLSSSKVDCVCELLKLAPREKEYFQCLLQFTKAKNPKDIEVFYAKLLSFKEVGARILGNDNFIFYQYWWNAAIYALFDTFEFKGDYEALAAKLVPAIEVEQARESVALMERLGLLVKDAAGVYRLTERHLSTPDSWKSLAVDLYQRSAVQLAAESLARFPKSQRNAFTITMSVDPDAFDKIRHLTEEYHQSVLRVVEECQDTTMVAQFCSFLFPLSSWPQEDEK